MAEYERIPGPGFTSPTNTYTQDELLYSTARFTQKGVTLAGGQGILPTGTVLAQNSTTKLWYAYDTNGSNGLDVARGVLRKGVNTGLPGTTVTQQGNIVISGILKNSLVSGADNDAITQLGARRDTVLGTFTF